MIRQKAVSGIKWSTLSQAGRQGIQLLSTALLAHLLAPEDFGLLGMALVVIGFIGIFKDLGTSAAVIQQTEPTPSLLSSLFWVNAGFGALFAILLFLLAPLAGWFYSEPQVSSLLQALSAGFFISGLGVLHQALLERSIAFKSLAILEIISILAGAIVGIGLALNHAGVWSLVFQSLVTTLVATLLLWRISLWRPHWLFSWFEVRKVMNFSLNLVGFNIFNYFSRNADYLLIGYYLGAQDLGYYTLAYRLLLFPLQNISAVIGRVMYPVLSSLQTDDHRFARFYLKIVGGISVITFPLMMGAFIIAKPLVLFILGERWQPVITLIMILAPVGLIQSVGTSVGVIYQAKNRTDWMFRWGVASGAFVVVALVFGLRWGIVGVAAAYAVASFLLIYPGAIIPFRLINLRFSDFLATLRLPFYNSLLMLLVLLFWQRFLSPSRLVEIELLVMISLGIAVYALGSWLTNRVSLKEMWFLIWERRSSG